MRLRQIAFAVRDLEPSVEQVASVLGLEVAHRDPEVAVFGLANAVLPIGDQFLEVLAPDRAGTSAGRYLERRGGDTGYMLIFQSDDLPRDAERILADGVRVVFEIGKPGAAYHALHFHPRDVGGVLVSFDQPGDPAAWPPAGRHWRDAVRTQRVAGFDAVEIEAEDPDALARDWARWLGAAADGRRITLGDVRLDFAPAKDRGPGLAALRLRATDPQAVLGAAQAARLAEGERTLRLCGTRIELG